MLNKENIICISSIDWDFIWQGHQEIMSALAKNGNRVLFIENTGVRSPGIKDIYRLKKRFGDYFKGIKGIRKEMDGLYVYSPIVLPFPYSRVARQINKFILLSVISRWMKVMNFSNPIVWTFLPTGITLDVINGIDKKLVIYHCVDNFAGSSASAKKVKATEEKLLNISDTVFVTSKALYEHCIKHNDRVAIFPSGVNTGDFEKIRAADTPPPRELDGIKKPIIGYVGGIHKWVDQELVKFSAVNRPGYSFVFVGPLQTDISLLAGIGNIHFLGNKKHDELPNLIKSFSVATIPYLVTEYTKNVYPMKLNEYLAMGKAVVSTDLPEVNIFNEKYRDTVVIGKDSREFTEGIDRAIKNDNREAAERRVKISGENSWKNRIEQMSCVIEKAIEEKMAHNEASWKENLLRTAGRRVMRLAAALAVIYILIFYTPAVWFLAEPLKLTDAPHKADAIVVFAGGVGESGEAGQGYLERVEQAVELYKAGYAKNIIFSSGYMYIFKEPLVMKALAVSLGVPAEAIILEDKARNTYQNVGFSERIMKDKGWNEILLVSSPYHMRRVSMVFKKIGSGIKVSYIPVLQSSFYRHRTSNFYAGGNWKQVNYKQIEGILREYSAIIYYWWKGYI